MFDHAVSTDSSLWRSNRGRLAAVCSARIEALSESSQLDLATEAMGCKAVLDWTLCKVASSFAIKDASSPLVQHAMQRTGGIGLLRLGGPETPGVSEGAVPELALALSCSEHAARDYIAVGLDLRFRLPITNNELGGGRITFAHAKVIAEATRILSWDAAQRIDARLADAATSRTPARLRVLARRLVAKIDPEAMRARHSAAMDQRGASAGDVGDGMGVISVDHQLDVIAAIDSELDAWARRRRLEDSSTSFSAHRADAAVLLLLGQDPMTGLVDEGATTVPFPARTELRVTMSADTLLNLDDATCELDGWGPITADQARRLAIESASTILRRVFTDPIDDSVMTLDAGTYRFTRAQVEAIAAVHPISCFPGATTPATKSQIDHRIPYRTGPPGRPEQPDPPGQTTVVNGQPLGVSNHRIKTHLEWLARAEPGDPHTVTWTSPYGRRYVVEDHDGA